MDLQTIFRFVRISTFFTLESFTFFVRRRIGFPFQELLFSSLIPPQSWGTYSLLPCHSLMGCSLPGVQGKGEGRANGEGDVESLPHVGQCLAKIQALGHQGRVIISHCSWHHLHRPKSHWWSLRHGQNNWKDSSHFIWINWTDLGGHPTPSAVLSKPLMSHILICSFKQDASAFPYEREHEREQEREHQQEH